MLLVAAADTSDHEQDPIKLSSLSPARVELDGVAVQIACGLQHTGLPACLSLYHSISLSVCLCLRWSHCVGHANQRNKNESTDEYIYTDEQ